MVTQVKKRRITTRDLESVEGFITTELAKRKKSKFRLAHETIWEVVDRQIAMERPKVTNRSGDPDEDWHAAVQLGDLADASEIITADIMRLMFPAERMWFQPHADLSDTGLFDGALRDPDSGQVMEQTKVQRIADGVLRSLMAQQHSDFGLQARLKLSLKESLHHGSMVAEVRWGLMSKFPSRGQIDQLGAPVWIPHSMWNSYPDESPSIIGTDLFYRGSMIVESFMPMHKVLDMEGWKNLDRVKASAKGKEDNEVTITTYWGDIVIDRSDGQIFVPNQKIILANDIWVEFSENPLPYPPIIYTGYERDDVRDPYYSSPLIKRSPMHHLATVMLNRFIDAVELKTEPPVAYDSLDPRFAESGGPSLAPGMRIPTKGSANLKVIDTADPQAALSGLQFAKQHVVEGTGTDALRKGVSAGTEQTATEVIKQDQRSEIRTVDFLGTLARHGLKPFLYMQHDFNLARLRNYPFFNNQINTPDFLRASKNDLPKSAHFEVVGFRAVLGEEQRLARLVNAVAIVGQNPLLAERTDWDEVSQQIWQESGLKDPERFVQSRSDQEQIAAAIEQVRQEAAQQIAALQEELGKLQLVDQRRLAEGAQANSKIQELQTDNNALEEQLRIERQANNERQKLQALAARIEKQMLALQEQRGEDIEQVRVETQTNRQVLERLITEFNNNGRREETVSAES